MQALVAWLPYQKLVAWVLYQKVAAWLPYQTLVALLPYIFVVVSMVATLGLFIGMSRRLGKVSKAVATCETWTQAEAAQITNAVNELKRRVAELETQDRDCSDLEPAMGLTNAARGKVYKLHRSGEAADHIAQKLRLPKGEVDLLIKVQQVVMRPYENPGAGINRAAP